MAKAISTLSIKVDLKDTGAQAVIDKIGSSISKLKVISGPTSQTIQKLRNEVTQLGQKGNNSISTIEGQISALKGLRREADLNSKEFKELTGDIEKYTEKLQKAQGKQKRKGIGGRQLAQGVGAIAAGGIFGGPEGLVGGGIGLALGGPGGAAVGAALGAQVGGIRKALGAIAEYGAQLNKLRIALRGVSASQSEYNRALDIVQQATKDFAIPQSILTRQFTKLQASVSGAGGTVADTQKAFRGIVAAVRATGGSLNDVDAALTATAQVFSKGKVSAEELRQQIGERLPGAFTLFASSIGKTPAELDKALEDGKVTLQDFLTFSESIFQKYGETAQIIADGPDGAGDRLKVSLEQLNEKVAPELARLGAQFQNFADNALQGLIRLFDALDRFGKSMEEKIDGDKIELRRNALANAKRQLVRTDLTPIQRDFQTKILEKNQAFFDDYDFIGPPTPDVSKLSGPDDDDDSKGKGRAKAENAAAKALERRRNAAAELARRLQNAVAASRAQNEVEKLLAVQAAKRNDLQAAFAKLQKDGFDAQVDQSRIAAEEALNIAQSNQLRKRSNDLIEKAREPLKQVNQRLKDKIASDEEYRKLLAEGVNPELAKEFIEINRVAEASIRLLEIEITRLKAAGQITEELERQIEILEQGKKDIEDDAEDSKDKAKKKAKEPTIREGLITNINELEQELKDLVNPINAITNAANAIGDAFTDSFMSVITGSATTQEALSSFFKNVGKFFLDMAAQIIQKMITLFILNQVVGLLPAPGGGGKGALDQGTLGSISSYSGITGSTRFAKGATFEKNKIIPYAKGGIVNRPTLFPYADGGKGRFGLMGEAGPEAIMPLQRGSDGKLGVSVTGNMRAAMARYKGTGTTGSASRASESSFSEDGSVALGGAIDVRFNVERINNVDYVTADEFQAGMREAATQGAKQGEQRALTTLRQNTTQRKRVGLQ